ncbi:158_t:CDS:2 [Cetraspora pellucida]|uniref:158_t:CDS:1 n=1 Tax=Cetraspora pellucida TaxID=1433469 RepID=A0A9N8WAA3_9GLOM|nr:158_t:CDS:2 [Cetraspora pellucida]
MILMLNTVIESNDEYFIYDDKNIFTSTLSHGIFSYKITTNNSQFDDESDESDNSSDSLKLVSGLNFYNYEKFKTWLNRFALETGFNYKVRTSKIKDDVIRRTTYECIKSGFYVLQIISNPTKRHNTCS